MGLALRRVDSWTAAQWGPLRFLRTDGERSLTPLRLRSAEGMSAQAPLALRGRRGSPNGPVDPEPTDAPTEAPRVLFLYDVDSSFVRTDRALLSTFCDVVPLRFTGKPSYASLLGRLTSADIVVSWFALGFSAVANTVGRLLRTRSIVMAGGWDVLAMPEIGYGGLLTEWGVLRARVSLSMADTVLAFSNWSENAIREVAPRSRVRTAYLGIDVSAFRPKPKEDCVLTVANVNRENLDRKGLRTFARASREIPEFRFVVAGSHSNGAADELRRIGGGNLTLPGRISDDEMRDLMGRARVYAQPSYTEGFGVALAEAMSCACVPVVTKAGAIPEVVGDAGIYVPYGDVAGLADGIRRAAGSDLGPEARSRVEGRFSLAHRLDDLRRAVSELL